MVSQPLASKFLALHLFPEENVLHIAISIKSLSFHHLEQYPDPFAGLIHVGKLETAKTETRTIWYL